MKIYQRHFMLSFLIVCMLMALFISAQVGSQTQISSTARAPSVAQREEAYRANNLGVALLEQYNYKDAAEAFRRALAINPKLFVARINLAIALYYLPDLPEAQRAARAASELAPRAPEPHYILGLIAKTQSRTDEAINHFRVVLELDPQDVGSNIQLGQLYVQARRYAEAVTVFRRALAAEPYNTTAIYSLAQALPRSGAPTGREESKQLLTRFQQLRQSGAGTSLGQTYLEQGRYAEAVTTTGAEPELVERTNGAVTFADASASMLPASVSERRAEEPPPAPIKGRTAQARDLMTDGRLTEAGQRRLAAAQGGGVTLFDYDADGDLDLFEVAPASQRLYRNDKGKFVDVTEVSGLKELPTGSVGIGAVAGDYDNDNLPDLFVLRYNSEGKAAAAGVLYHNENGIKFSDQTTAANLPAYPYLSVAAAMVDADHDGDLDIFIAGFADLNKTTTGDPKRANVALEELAGAPNMLLRNNGDGKFTDVTEAAKVAGKPQTLNRAVAVVPTDYDNRRDIDLLLVNYGAPPALYRNLRNGKFLDVAAETGLNVGGRFTCAAAGDVNKDGFTDFFFGRVGEPGLLAASDGQTKFNMRPMNVKQGEGENANAAPFVSYDAAQIFDYDNDGLLDIVAVSDRGLRVWRNVGDGWAETSARVLPPPPAQGSGWARSFASGDVDADGDADMIFRFASGELKALRNDGGNRNRSVRVRLAGRVSNRSAIAAKIEARAGSLWQKLETYAASPAPAPADIIFGLGARDGVDAVRVIWTSGIVQAETQAVATSRENGRGRSASDANERAPILTLSITELDRKPSSCPYLFAWNGERFGFVTDMMGGGEIGYWQAPNVWNVPDPDEYVRIRSDQLKERNGRYELRITNELEEALFMDRVRLIGVAHPEGVEVYPNEGLLAPPLPPFKLYRTRGARPPLSAIDDDGADVLERLRRVDRTYPDNFPLRPIRGYAGPHALTLTLDKNAQHSKRTLLLMTAWTDYAFSSDNVAAHQSGLALQPPALQVKNKEGEWQTVIENVGIPVGRPQTIVVDLTGKFLTDSREVRVTTNMRIYWDQVLVDTSDGDFPAGMTNLEPVVARLDWRGFSAQTTPDGRAPFGYDYDQVSPTSPWKTFPGRYTREGDVRELLSATDDMFVISMPGDEIKVEFDAASLPILPRGWTRTFLLYVAGFSKEMDINSATPDAVAPLPFHDMKSYPYGANERYPDTPAHRDYIERYNTRVVSAPLRRLK